jgi:hypothetical protein
MLRATNLIGCGAGQSGTPFEVTNTDERDDEATGSSVTFTTVSFGDDDATRYVIVVAVNSEGNLHSITDIDIGSDTSATQLAFIEHSAGSGPTDGVANVAIYAGQPTGTSGSVVVTFAGTRHAASSLHITVWRMVGGTITGLNTMTDDGTPDCSGAITVADGDVVLAGAITVQNASLPVLETGSKDYTGTSGSKTISHTRSGNDLVWGNDWSETNEISQLVGNAQTSSQSRGALAAVQFKAG